MIVLAVLLLVAVAAVVAFVLLAGVDAPSVPMTVGALELSVSPVWIFVLGVVTLLVAELAVSLLGGGSRRKLAKRRELKRLRKAESRGTTTADTGTGAGRRETSTAVKDGTGT